MSTRAARLLGRPYTLGSAELPNRIVMAPMTRAFSPGGVPGTDVAAYYARLRRITAAPVFATSWKSAVESCVVRFSFCVVSASASTRFVCSMSQPGRSSVGMQST